MTDTSTLFEMLSAGQRRRILLALCDADSVSLSAADRTRSGSAVAGSTERTPTDTDPTESRDREELLLIHSHLPKLEKAGLVEWDRDSRTVSRGPEFEEVEPALRLLAANLNRFPDDTV